jgi:transmembrane sensor
MVLQDGTNVWINEGSSLRFPEAFNLAQRIVHLRGEAYFEIVNDARPFVIKVSNARVTSMGGELDVSDYKGFRTAVILVKGDGFLDGRWSDIELKEKYRAYIGARGRIYMEDRWLDPFIWWKKEMEKADTVNNR